MANYYTYCYETGEDSCEYFDYEPDCDDKMNAIVDIAYEEFFETKGENKECEDKKKASIRRFISEYDLWDAVEEGMDDCDLIKDYFEDKAFESRED